MANKNGANFDTDKSCTSIISQSREILNSTEYIEGGYILMARKLATLNTTSDIWQMKPFYLKVWLYILLKVNFEDTEKFKRGENFFNFSEGDKIPKITKDEVYRAIKWLQKQEMITKRKTTRGVVIKVNNYEYFQNARNYEKPQGKPQLCYKNTTEMLQEYHTIKEELKNKENDISTTLLKEKEFLENNKGFHWRGEYQNVGLTDKQIYSLEVYIGSSKKLKEYIDSLSENIEEKKEEKFDFEFPNMHEIRIKKYFKAERKNRKVEKTEKSKTEQIKRELTVEEQIKRDMELIGHDYEPYSNGFR